MGDSLGLGVLLVKDLSTHATLRTPRPNESQRILQNCHAILQYVVESKGSYQFFDHMADVGIHVEADSLEALFTTAGLALMEFIGPEPKASKEANIELAAEAEDWEELLVRWLQELLYLFQQAHTYAKRTREIHLIDKKLRAIVVGKEWNESTADAFREVKAVTYHQLNIRREGDIWSVNIILDI